MGLVVAAVLLVSVLLSAKPALARFSFEDPQLCVNNQLLTIQSTARAEVWVRVPKGAVVDFNVADCGGTDMVIARNHVVVLGKGPAMEVLVTTRPFAQVTMWYNGKTDTKGDRLGIVLFRALLP